MAINTFDRTDLDEARVLGKYYGIEDFENMTHEELLNAIDAISAINQIFTDVSGNRKSSTLTVTRDLSGNFILNFVETVCPE